MFKKTFFIVFVFLAISVGLYPVIYFIIDREFGLLAIKTDELLADTAWNIGFYTHIIASGIALLTGWIQFNKKIRERNISFHRLMGKIYITFVIAGSLTGIYIGWHATAGPVAAIGFIGLGIVWFCTTMEGFRLIRNKNTEKHRVMMMYSYAACFAAVTLRIWLPILIASFGNFNAAYMIVAWLCWVPNLLFVRFVLLRQNSKSPISGSVSV